MAGRGSTTAQHALTEQDVTAVREEVSAGRTVTVWFTSAAVGVPAGGSAKVVTVGDVEEGDFIQVRPAGSRDAVFCSPGELTRSRPARRSAEPRQPAVTSADDTTAPPVARARPVRTRRSVGSTESAAPSPSSADLPGSGEPEPESRTSTKPEKAAPVRARRRAERAGGLTVSLTSNADGEWTVEVLAGAKRVVPSTPVQATDVAAVSHSLPTAVAEVIRSTLDEARRRQQERVANLREELDAAQRTLDQLGGD